MRARDLHILDCLEVTVGQVPRRVAEYRVCHGREGVGSKRRYSAAGGGSRSIRVRQAADQADRRKEQGESMSLEYSGASSDHVVAASRIVHPSEPIPGLFRNYSEVFRMYSSQFYERPRTFSGDLRDICR